MFSIRYKIKRYTEIRDNFKSGLTSNNVIAKIEPRQWYIDFLRIKTFIIGILT